MVRKFGFGLKKKIIKFFKFNALRRNILSSTYSDTVILETKFNMSSPYKLYLIILNKFYYISYKFNFDFFIDILFERRKLYLYS